MKNDDTRYAPASAGNTTSDLRDEDDMQFAFRMMREFLASLDLEIKLQPSSQHAKEIALGVTKGVRAYVDHMAFIAASYPQQAGAVEPQAMPLPPTERTK